MEETSLDDFLGGGSTAEKPAEDGGPGDDGTVEVESPPAVSRWTADGEPCGSCGEPARRLWSDDGRIVCGDCKDW